MNKMGRAALFDLFGDFILFRSLEPLDSRLSGLPEIRQMLRLPENHIPRKVEPEYGTVVAEILKNAHYLRHPGSELDTLLYIGDTPGSDLKAFRNICLAGNFSGTAFIGRDTPRPSEVQIRKLDGRIEIKADRWSDLGILSRVCSQEKMAVGKNALVLIDIDKTVYGARGRNDQLINQARVEAIRSTLASALGNNFDLEEFETSYSEFNQNHYHYFTADNQDIVAYICLIVGSELISRDTLVANLKEEKFQKFDGFLDWVEEQRATLNHELCDLHEKFYQRMRAGDPTPFKEFRREEYRQTVLRMGTADDTLQAEELLKAEIVITGEVFRTARELEKQGAVLFGLSDKPDEATLPFIEDPDHLPLHRIMTHIVGSGE